MFDKGESVVVGCSGGPDSTCLLHVLAAGLASLRLKCTAVYIDHGLRRGTEAERDVVRKTAESVGAAFGWRPVDVKAHVRRHGGSTQAVARELRYAALREAAREAGARKIAVGHTLSDQAETVLLQLLRGAGARGLAGIAPVLGEVVRPLLGVRREETVRYCREHGLETVDDPSNLNAVYLRNRVRLELMPALRTYNPAVEERLAGLAEISRAEDEYLQDEALKAFESLVRPPAGEKGLVLDGRALSELPLALSRRVVRIAASRLGARLAFRHVEDILEAAGRREGSEILDHLPGLSVRREYERLVFCAARSPKERASGAVHAPSGAPRTEPAAEGRVELPIPGSVDVAWAGITITAQVLRAGEVEAQRRSADSRGLNRALVDLDAVVPPLYVRPRRPGDRISPLGLGGSKKLQDLLTDAKVPRAERSRVAVVEDAVGILWVVGHALDERVRLRDGTVRALSLAAATSEPCAGGSPGGEPGSGTPHPG